MRVEGPGYEARLARAISRGVIPGGGWGAGGGGGAALQLLASNTFFGVFTQYRQKGTIRSGVNGFFYVNHIW